MADALSWIFEKVGGKVIDKVIELLTPSELTKRLTRTIENWAAGLPPEHFAEPTAMFATMDADDGPARRILRTRLTDSQPPTQDEWYAALLERWRVIKEQTEHCQPFFTLPEYDAAPQLCELAARLARVCQADEKMLRSSLSVVLGRIDRQMELKEQAGACSTEDGATVLYINDFQPPREWSQSYELGIHAYNGSGDSVMLDRLRVDVLGWSRVEHYAVQTPGAPLIEHHFSAHLRPVREVVSLQSVGPRRFLIAPGSAEFFTVSVTAESGWEYDVRLAATQTIVRNNNRDEILSGNLILSFSNTL